MPRTIKCPCCDSKVVKYLGALPNSNLFAGKTLSDNINGGALYKCFNCHLKYRLPTLEDNEYNTLYNNSETLTWGFKNHRSDWEIITEYIDTLPKTKKKDILDYGCYTGGFLFQLDNSIEKNGIEINQAAADSARKNTRALIWEDLNEIPNDKKFNIIVLIDVIEHMKNPADLLIKLKKKLKPNGCIIITTGNAENKTWNFFKAHWWYCYYPEHISFISSNWAEWLSKNHDFSFATTKKFKLGNLPFKKKLNQLLHIIGYGILGKWYLFFLSLLKGNISISVDPGGKGLLKDHILIVLENN